MKKLLAIIIVIAPMLCIAQQNTPNLGFGANVNNFTVFNAYLKKDTKENTCNKLIVPNNLYKRDTKLTYVQEIPIINSRVLTPNVLINNFGTNIPQIELIKPLGNTSILQSNLLFNNNNTNRIDRILPLIILNN